MQKVGSTKTYVIARENNVVLIDFRRTNPPAPRFRGGGALRVVKGIEEDARGWLRSDAEPRRQTA
jgi:hypothetical protein